MMSSENKAQPTIQLVDVIAALQQPRPGLAAQQRMAPVPRHHPQPSLHGAAPRQSAVLVLLYPSDDTLNMVLTRRSEQLSHHKGQVSLPGGAQEHQDPTLAATAFRETEEELGISLHDAQLLGQLTPIYTGSSNYQIHPFVAYTTERPNGIPSATEVAEVLHVPLGDLLDVTCQRREIWPLHGQSVQVPFFLLNGHKVWGATAMILSEFIALLQRAENPL